MRYVVGVNVLNLALMFAAADINLRPLIERNTGELVQHILTLEEMAKDALDKANRPPEIDANYNRNIG